jgi:acyl-CoA dehydrogenase
MSESLPLLCETAEKLFRDLAERQAPFAAAWAEIEAAGFPLLLTPEVEGGFGGDWQDAFAVLRIAGAHALAAPLAEAIAAAHVSRRAGWAPRDGLTVIATSSAAAFVGDRFTGTVAAPWGRAATYVIARVSDRVVRLAVADAAITESSNTAGDPRDALRFDGAAAEDAADDDIALWGALARTAQIAGALDAALSLSITYANERVQFGKPIGKFQAVQQSLAEFAEEAAAVNCAGRAAACAADCGDASMEIAAAKLRAGQAAAIGARVAHQVHGAIGFTHEHELHRYTTRLTSWRSEYGNERSWSAYLGAWAVQQGADGLWPAIVARADAQNGG